LIRIVNKTIDKVGLRVHTTVCTAYCSLSSFSNDQSSIIKIISLLKKSLFGINISYTCIAVVYLTE
jgi:hypothetical protein